MIKHQVAISTYQHQLIIIIIVFIIIFINNVFKQKHELTVRIYYHYQHNLSSSLFHRSFINLSQIVLNSVLSFHFIDDDDENNNVTFVNSFMNLNAFIHSFSWVYSTFSFSWQTSSTRFVHTIGLEGYECECELTYKLVMWTVLCSVIWHACGIHHRHHQQHSPRYISSNIITNSWIIFLLLSWVKVEVCLVHFVFS